MIKLNSIGFSLVLGLFVFLTLFFASAVFANQGVTVDSSQNNLRPKIALISVIFCWLLYFLIRIPGRQKQKPSLDTYQVAYLAGGRDRAVELAIARLVYLGYLLPNVTNRTFAIAKKVNTELKQLEKDIMEQVKRTPEFKKLKTDSLPQTSFLKISLRQHKLLVDEVWSITFVTTHVCMVFICSFIFGFGVVSFVFTLLSYTYLRHLAVDLRTRWGDRILGDLRKRNHSFDPIQRFALYGESTLSGGTLDDLKQIYKAQQEGDTGGCGCGC